MHRPNVFRQVSLDRLSSPEQLDRLMRVTNPRGWIALAALGLLVVSAIAWGVKGSLPDKVYGQGMLLKSGGIVQLTAPASGSVTDIAVSIGDTVNAGQVVVRIAQPALLDRIQQAKMTIDKLRQQSVQLDSYGGREAELQAASLAQQRRSIEQSMVGLRQSLVFLEEKVTSQQQLVSQGLLTKQTLLTTQQQRDSTEEKIRVDQNDLAQIDIKRLQLEAQRQRDQQQSQSGLREAENQMEELQRELKASEVVSSYTGRILEITAEQGSIVSRGEPLITLDLVGRAVKELEAVVYIPSSDGKKVKPGMSIQIAPSTVKPEEYGLMLGRVTYVSDFPASSKGMQVLLKNQQLVGQLSGGGAPYEVRADLLLDIATSSGYHWTSSSGPPLKIHSGTLCAGEIVVERQRPIDMVIPLMRKYTGL